MASFRSQRRVADVGNMPEAEKSPFPPAPSSANDATEGFMTYFVDSLHWPWVRACILGLFVMHLAVRAHCPHLLVNPRLQVSIYCCTLVNTDFDMENLYLKESPLTPISQKMQRFVLNESFVVNFVLTDMGSFESAKRRELFNSMIIELESIAHFGMGEKGTNLWIRDFELVGGPSSDNVSDSA